ncbi:RagB/SusD family nutrient uptake outer membrane protein [Dysgonomonas sp. Marseille-P4677]|uniref:RagB/SusD family nutrient uptake outer membrane protein n=1 Tax=Dysgonomonas sp. Marseille-P4677 TaxID=2364790 RepID=UPI00191167E7|nr:RagB/SusD family nutrient uptake outer membrane protein [Dysgonomonas sp. Marseille-P4677]MBK5720903.1 RagB/SusD family nutrient uptake outer membrane protein [Dysgonomonas sp. Marseille-P4677]
MKKINQYLLSGLISAFTLMGCSADFLDTAPRNTVSSENIWTSAALAEKAVGGVYNTFVGWYCAGYSNNGNRVWDSYSSVMDIDLNWISQNALVRGTATPSNGQFSSAYTRGYTMINRANDVIANINSVPNMKDSDKARYMAECKFLRAWAYNRLNILFKGVPLITEPITNEDQAKAPRASEAEIWNQVLKDLTDAINEPNLPNKYKANDANYGHVTKGAAYAFRGQVYLWLKKWQDAANDFKAVGDSGYSLFTSGGSIAFKNLLKTANEQCDEMIFSVQCEQYSVANPLNVNYGNRCTGGSMWNNYLPNPHFIESFEAKDGSKFNWEDYCPGYNSMTSAQRSVFFLRDGMTDAEITKMATYGADMSKYLPDGNEARIRKAYENRDPRLMMSVITPYSTYFGSSGGKEYTYTLRWPYRGFDGREPFDIRTDTNNYFYYLWRKFVPEGNEWPYRDTYDLDVNLIRYGQVLLGYAEALNELGNTDQAIEQINKLRSRCGAQLLNSNDPTTVKGQDDMRERIRNEYYWELGGENVMYWNELRWRTWKEKKFRDNKNGLMQMWGTTTYTWSWLGEQCWTWPIPTSEREKNPSLTQNEGWND